MGKWIFGAIAGVLLLFGIGQYNGLVSSDEAVKKEWGEVQNQIKRRFDLIPNLVRTVEGYAEHERGVFREVTEARAKVGQAVNVDVSKLANDPLLQKQLLEATQGLGAALSRLIAVAENYPQLKANESFLKLQDELAGTENRIAVARGRAIDATRQYNQSVRSFPTVLVARVLGFEVRAVYEVPAEQQEAPKVDFNRK